MKDSKLKSDGFLFKEDYIEIAQKIVSDLNPGERIQTLYKFYNEKNPGFLENLMGIVRPVCWFEYSQLKDSEIDNLMPIVHPEFIRTIDESKLREALLIYQQIKVGAVTRVSFNEGELTSSDFVSAIPNIDLYMELLKAYVHSLQIVSKAMPEEKRTEGNEKVGNKFFTYTENRKGEQINLDFTARERLAILRLFQETSSQNKKFHLDSGMQWTNEKEKYQRFLSLITGIKRATLDDLIDEEGYYFDSVIKTATPDQAKYFLNSIKKIKKVFEGLDNNGAFHAKILAFESKLEKKLK